MKLRMYIRGLGLGLIVAALVLSFGIKADNRTMSDAEIRSKARELGMVDESTTLKEAAEAKEEIKEEPVTEENVVAEEEPEAEEPAVEEEQVPE